MSAKPINPFAWHEKPDGIVEAITAFLGKTGYALIERQYGGVTMMVLHERRDNQWHPVLWVKTLRPNTDGKENGMIETRPLNQPLADLPLATTVIS